MPIIRPTEKIGTVRGRMAVVECKTCHQPAWANFRRTTVGKPQEVRTVCCGSVQGLSEKALVVKSESE